MLAAVKEWATRKWRALLAWAATPADGWDETAHSKPGREIVGDLLRETAVLILVFGILDPFVGERRAPPYPWPVWGWFIGGSTAVALGAGGWVEVSRRRRMNPALFAMLALGGIAALGVAGTLLSRLPEDWEANSKRTGPKQPAAASTTAAVGPPVVQMIEASKPPQMTAVASASPTTSTEIRVNTPPPSASQPRAGSVFPAPIVSANPPR